jgi:hypothetical protein
MHGGRIHQHVLEAHVGKFGGHDPLDDRSPQPRGLEHIGLIDRRELAAPRARETGGEAHDAFDFLQGIAAHIDGFGRRARLIAEVDAAGQFAHHHDVHAAQQLRLDGRGVEDRGVRHHGAQIGEQPQRLA